MIHSKISKDSTPTHFAGAMPSIWSRVGLALTLFALASCGDDEGSPSMPMPSGSETGSSAPGSDTSSHTDTMTSSGASSGERVIVPTEGFAINETFDDWTGTGGREFTMAKGDSPYPDHNTVQNIAGQDCLLVHANAVDNMGYGFSVEVMMNLDMQTDMSGEDYELSYDVYIPAATFDLGANMQFGLYRMSDMTPIYSVWYSGSLKADEWVTLTTPINTVDGLIDYSGFENNPDDWVFDAVAIQAIFNGTGADVGSEIQFCIDNLAIRQVSPQEQANDEREERIAKPTPYAVWIDGQAQPVDRVGKFEVPVNYVQYTYPGAPMEIEIASAVGLQDVKISPKSLNIVPDLGTNVMTLQIDEPQYVIVDIPGQERLFLFIDPPEVDEPLADGAMVKNVLNDGVDNTGASDVTAALQAAIDAASGSAQNVVYVPSGVYSVDGLFLRDNMTLYLAQGAVLQYAKPQEDLITLPTDLAVIEGAGEALIKAKGVTGAKLLGRGTLDGNGVILQDFGRKAFLLKIEDSTDIQIDGVIARDSAFWNTLIYRSSNVHFTNYKVVNNQLPEDWNETDGVDFNNCTDSSLTRAFIYAGDDCMAVKSDDIEDAMPQEGITDPTMGAYISVANVTHTDIICHSASSGCKIGTKTFGPTMTAVQFVDVDIVQALRGLVIDAVDTATIDQTLFKDVRMETITGALVDFNMDPAAITWRTNPGTCTVTNTTVSNVAAAENKPVQIKGNIHDYEETDPFFGNEYLIDGVVFENFSVAGTPITALDSAAVTFETNEYAVNISFVQTPIDSTDTSSDTGSSDTSVASSNSSSDTGSMTTDSGSTSSDTASSSDASSTSSDTSVASSDTGSDSVTSTTGTDSTTGSSDTTSGTGSDMVWLPSWATSIQRTEDSNEPPPLGDQTLRQFVWPSYSGGQIRLQLSNERGEAPVVISKVHVAKALPLAAGEIDVTTDTALTWAASESVTIEPGATAWSDPVAFDLVELTPVAITMHFTTSPVDITGHPGARTTSYVGTGDQVSAATVTGETRDRWYFIDAIEVMAPADAYAVAILGDSITDGYGVLNKFARWPDFLNIETASDPVLGNTLSVLNFGMGANCLTAPGTNDDQDPGTVRFERDVLGRKDKIRWLIVYIGVNDIIYCGATAATITAAYQDIIDRSHAEGIAVYGATITPFETDASDPAHLALRDEVNTWITTSGAFDGVIDFATIMADPRSPSKLNPPLSNDGLHPSHTGYEVLGRSVGLSLFETMYTPPAE